MSTYSQSEVARIVESVLPDILKSGDPHTTLIKRATELNLPPSVLEKAGQVYNTAKTLNHLEGVDQLEKRGHTFSTLDVPALVAAYEGYNPDEASKPAPADDPWQAALFDKAASADPQSEYELPQGFNPLLHDYKNPVEKMASSASVNSFEGEDQGEKIRLQRAKAAAERDLETCRDLVNTLERNFIRKAATLADQYLGLYVDAPAMDQLEAEVAKVSGKPELVKQAFDKIASLINQHPASRKHIKRASETTRVGLVMETAYHDQVHQALDHLELLNAAREEYADLEKAAAKYNRGFNEGDKDGDKDPEKKNKSEESKSQEQTTAEQPPVKQPTDDEAKATGEDDQKIPSTQAQPQAAEDVGEAAEDVGEAAEDVGEAAEDVGEAESLYRRRAQLKEVWKNPIIKEYRGKGVDAVISDMQSKQHERQAEIDNAGLLARGEAALNTLLLTDPVISEYDEEQMRDIFFTVLQENPSVATDINELRGILRAAGSFDGVVDVESVKQLKTLRKLEREASGGPISKSDDESKKK